MKGDDLYKEREHLKFWDDCLNDLKKQFDILSNVLDLIKKIKIQRMTELNNILSKFKTDINPYSQEPSHLYNVCEMYLNFISILWEVINKFNDELYKKINAMNNDITKNLDIQKKKLYDDNMSLIDGCQNLINEIKIQENEFNKEKELMKEVEIYRNKIKNKIQNIYNVSENKKADLALAERIKKMEDIKIPMEENKKKLKEYRVKLTASFSLVFENYFSIYFKHLAILNQYFYLLDNSKLDILSNMQKQIKSTIFLLSNLNFELNDYTEKKFGESLGIKYEGLILLDPEDLLNKSSNHFLLKISYSIINYVKIFMKSVKYRKKILEYFIIALKSIRKLELNILAENSNSIDELLNLLKSIKYTSENNSKKLNLLISGLKNSNEDSNYELFISGLEDYINFFINEYNNFELKWKEIKEKLIQKQNSTKLLLKKEKENNNKDNKDYSINNRDIEFRDIIINSIKFMKDNIYSIRNKDKNKMQRLSASFEKLLLKYKNFINKKIAIIQIQLSNLINMDIYEESKTIIIKYFNIAKVRNYIGFLEKMKQKFIYQFQNIDIKEEVINKSNIQNSREQNNNNNLLENNDNILLEEEDDFTNSSNLDSQFEIFKFNSNNLEKSEIKKLNTLFKDSRKFLFESNNNNIQKNIMTSYLLKNLNKNELSKENNSNINNNILKESNKKKYSADTISLDLLNKNKFAELTKIENPYKNIKEEDLKHLKEITEKKMKDDELEKDETILDSFNCALKDKILLQGKFIITNKRIWFKSLFNTSTFFGKTTIMIPLNDIISIEKKYYLMLDNSIEVKTEKVSYFFTSYLSRDNCFNLLQGQLNKIKEVKSYRTKSRKKSDIGNNYNKYSSSSPSKFQEKKILFSYKISKAIKSLCINQKLFQLAKERLSQVIKKYRDEKNLIFIPGKTFSKKILEKRFNKCPLYIFFKYICKASTQIDELGKNKGFFESILLQDFSKDIIFIEKEEDNEAKIPKYFNDENYLIDLYTSFDKNKFLDLFNEVNDWIYKYEYNCYKNKKNDAYIVYFLSPSILIFDIILYSKKNDNNYYNNNYTPVFRFKFESNINFNQTDIKFEVITKLTVFFDIFLGPKCIMASEEKNKIMEKYESDFKNIIFDKLIKVVNKYQNLFNARYDRLNEESIKKIINNNEFIYEEVDEFNNNIDNLEDINNENENDDFDEFQKNNNYDDIKTIKSIEINNINIINDSNYIKNINITQNSSNNNNDLNQIELNKEELIESNKDNKNNNLRDINRKKNIFNHVKSYIQKNENNILIFIIIIFMLTIILQSFHIKKSIYINIINLICLLIAIFILIKKK